MDIAQGLLILVFVIKSKAENSSKPPPIFAGGCLPNFHDLGSYGCFYIGNTAMTWTNAATWCQNLTQNGVPRIGLAEITSEDIQFMLSGLIIMHTNSPSTEYWLGARKVVRRNGSHCSKLILFFQPLCFRMENSFGVLQENH